MMIEVIIIITAVIWLVIASAYDLKWKYVPDYVNYSFIITALAIRALYAVQESNLMIMLWSLIGGGSLFLLGYLLYKTGVWGGGDVKVIIACGFLLSWFPGEATPFFINFAVNLMIIGALYGIPIVFAVTIKRKPKIILKNYERVIIPLSVFGAGAIIILMQSLYSIILGACLVLAASIRIFNIIENDCFIKKVTPDKLMDGDWLIKPLKAGGKTINPRKEGLNKKEVELIKSWYKKGLVKSVWIKDGIAYVPVFLITTILTLIFGNIMIGLIANGFYQ